MGVEVVWVSLFLEGFRRLVEFLSWMCGEYGLWG